MDDTCPICLSSAKIIMTPSDMSDIDCPRCGKFSITRTAHGKLRNNPLPLNNLQIANASGWIREHQGLTISHTKIEDLKNIETPSIIEKANKLLLYLSKSFPTPGRLITSWEKEFSYPALLAITWSQDPEEASFLFYDYLLKEKGFLVERGGFYVISPKGWSYIDSLNQINLSRESNTKVKINKSSRKEYLRDVFLCHCSEDKKNCVEPIIDQLSKEGVTYWYDKAEIKWGDSLLSKIHEGLKISQYVIVFLSKSFIKKGWPKYELENALIKEIKKGRTVVLPLLIGDENEIIEILNELEFLERKRYLMFSEGIENVIAELKNVLRG